MRRLVPAVRVPGAESEVELQIENRGTTAVTVRIAERPPEGFVAARVPAATPVELEANARRSFSYVLTAPQAEGPALITGTLAIVRQRQRSELSLETPIAVYPRQAIDKVDDLIDVRERLIAVTNFHDRCGQLLMLDAARYFREYLNVQLSDPVQRDIARDFAFTDVGLPAPARDYEATHFGDSDGVWGILRIKLDREETFTACDQLYETDRLREFAGEVETFPGERPA